MPSPRPSEGAPQWAIRLTQDIVDWVEQRGRGPQPLTSYAKAALPDATKFNNFAIKVPDEAGGATIAVSNGVNWLRVRDGAIVS